MRLRDGSCTADSLFWASDQWSIFENFATPLPPLRRNHMQLWAKSALTALWQNGACTKRIIDFFKVYSRSITCASLRLMDRNGRPEAGVSQLDMFRRGIGRKGSQMSNSKVGTQPMSNPETAGHVAPPLAPVAIHDILRDADALLALMGKETLGVVAELAQHADCFGARGRSVGDRRSREQCSAPRIERRASGARRRHACAHRRDRPDRERTRSVATSRCGSRADLLAS